MKFKIASYISTFFGVGNVRLAPGTFGSLATFPLFVVINILIKSNGIEEYLFISFIYLIDMIVLYLLGYWSIKNYISVNKKDDPSEVVIDEVIGQMLTYMVVAIYPFYKVNNYTIFNVLYIILPFLFFRLFDIKKPSLVGYFDRNWHNANGIILDDVMAGIFASICCIVILSLV